MLRMHHNCEMLITKENIFLSGGQHIRGAILVLLSHFEQTHRTLGQPVGCFLPETHPGRWSRDEGGVCLKILNELIEMF